GRPQRKGLVFRQGRSGECRDGMARVSGRFHALPEARSTRIVRRWIMIGILKDRLARAFPTKADETVWKSDPLMHPDIRRMDLNQVADLSMWAGWRHDDGSSLHPRNDTVCRSRGRYGGARCLLAAFLAALLLAEPFWASTGALAETPG